MGINSFGILISDTWFVYFASCISLVTDSYMILKIDSQSLYLKGCCVLFWIYNFKRPVSRVAKVAKATTETELIGINIAATIGERFPEIAKPIPIIL